MSPDPTDVPSSNELLQAFWMRVAAGYEVRSDGPSRFQLTARTDQRVAPVVLEAEPEAIVAYIDGISDAAVRTLGVLPAWRSAVALADIHLREVADMLWNDGGPGGAITLGRGGFQRHPAPTSKRPPGRQSAEYGDPSSWSASAALSGRGDAQ